jgi:hypothetical protein
MRRFVRRCHLFMQLPSREHVWFTVLFVGSGIVRAALLTLPLRRIIPCLGAHDQHGPCTARVTQAQQLQAWRIGRITALATKYTPWESTCLVQALVATWLLAYYRIPSVLHLGVARSTQPGNGLLAHAWLRVGPWIITGREGHQAFTVVATLPCRRGAQEET